MRIIIRGVEETAELRGFAEERLAGGVERFQEHILNATMRLEDVTGPEKGGVDKLCSIELKLRTGEIRIKEQGDDFHATINTALDRVKASLSREVSRAKRGIGGG
ncbi:MAG: HPF/RaiA family ribosome-associated protein [Phycisphaerae bacterium]|nr:HPF/RaiA family ribosome-associated protein [Phycisphaerae bacterium]